MPGWLKELVRLSTQGFHLVIVPLGIHTTVLPPETACLNTDSLKETSHCHFKPYSLLLTSLVSFLRLLSTPSTSLSTHAHTLLYRLSSFLTPPPTVFFLGSLIVCAFLIVSEQTLSAVMVVEIAAGAICGEQLIWQRGHRVVYTTTSCCLLDSPYVCFVHGCDSACLCTVMCVCRYVKLCEPVYLCVQGYMCL